MYDRWCIIRDVILYVTISYIISVVASSSFFTDWYALHSVNLISKSVILKRERERERERERDLH